MTEAKPEAKPWTWLVARSQPRREKWAAENLKNMGYECYMPMFGKLCRVDTSPVREIRAEFLFPGFIFVNSPLRQWHFLLGTFGIQRVYMQDETRPAWVNPKEIDRMKAMQDPSTGWIALPKQPAPLGLVKGQSARVSRIGHQFEGHVVIFEGLDAKGREKALLNFLGGKQRTLFDAGTLTPVAETQ